MFLHAIKNENLYVRKNLMETTNLYKICRKRNHDKTKIAQGSIDTFNLKALKFIRPSTSSDNICYI